MFGVMLDHDGDGKVSQRDVSGARRDELMPAGQLVYVVVRARVSRASAICMHLHQIRRVQSRDVVGNVATSLDFTFTTNAGAAPVVTSNLTASGTVGSAFSYQIAASN